MLKKYYALKCKDDSIRLKSSSGGAFFYLAKKVIDDKGVVYGAIYDNNNNIIHARITNEEEIYKAMGSKYSRSNITGIFDCIKKDLADGKKVLFSGTPCQVAALKKSLKNEKSDSLFTIDLVCHGTPDKKFYDDYKKWLEKKYNSSIIEINMRYKNPTTFRKNLLKKNFYGKNYEIIGEHNMYVRFENGKKYIFPSNLDPFFLNFDRFISIGCFSCPYSNLDRMGDITIGDYHQFNSKLKEFNDCNGISLIMINSKKGELLLENTKEKFELIEKNAKDILQPALESPAIKDRNHENFIKDYEKNGFEFVIKKYTPINMKFKLKCLLYKMKIYDMLITLKRIIFKK